MRKTKAIQFKIDIFNKILDTENINLFNL